MGLSMGQLMGAKDADINALLEYWKVRAETREGVTRIHVPPVPRLRDLPRGYWLAVYPLVVSAILAAQMVGEVRRNGTAGLEDYAVPVAMLSLASLAVVLAAVYQMRRYIILQIDSSELSLLRVGGENDVGTASWSRDKVSDVHINRSNGKLLFRAQTEEPVEIALTSSIPVNAWIVDRLQRALGETSAPSDEQAGLWCASPFLAHEPSARSDLRRKILLGIAFGIAIMGFFMFFTPAGLLGLYVLALAGVPAGIALGTQKKEYYL
jgi:hypothetical protein